MAVEYDVKHVTDFINQLDAFTDAGFIMWWHAVVLRPLGVPMAPASDLVAILVRDFLRHPAWERGNILDGLRHRLADVQLRACKHHWTTARREDGE